MHRGGRTSYRKCFSLSTQVSEYFTEAKWWYLHWRRQTYQHVERYNIILTHHSEHHSNIISASWVGYRRKSTDTITQIFGILTFKLKKCVKGYQKVDLQRLKEAVEQQSGPEHAYKLIYWALVEVEVGILCVLQVANHNTGEFCGWCNIPKKGTASKFKFS